MVVVWVSKDGAKQANRRAQQRLDPGGRRIADVHAPPPTAGR